LWPKPSKAALAATSWGAEKSRLTPTRSGVQGVNKVKSGLWRDVSELGEAPCLSLEGTRYREMFRATARVAKGLVDNLLANAFTGIDMIDDRAGEQYSRRRFARTTWLALSNASSRAAFIAAVAGSKTLDSKRSGMAQSIFHERRRGFEIANMALNRASVRPGDAEAPSGCLDWRNVFD
jgi:hypothetical protein